MKTRELTWISMLAVIIFLTGLIKLPALVPGFDFQLSSPFAVMIASLFGFRRYFIAGIISSTVAFALGVSTPLHIAIAILFRLAVGAWLELLGRNRYTLFTAGIVGSTFARICLGWWLNLPIFPLLMAALPGALAGGVVVLLFYHPVKRFMVRIGKREFLVQ